MEIDLPAEIWCKIARWTDVSTAGSLSCCCRATYEVAGDQRVWRRIFEREFGSVNGLWEAEPKELCRLGVRAHRAAMRCTNENVLVRAIRGGLLPVRGSRGATLFGRVIDMGWKKASKLVAEMVDPLARDHEGVTPLHLMAASIDYSGLFLRLLRGVVRLDVRDAAGRTPAHWAAALDNFGVVYVLGKMGANLEAEDDIGETPRDLADRRRHTLTGWLLDHRAGIIPAPWRRRSDPIPQQKEREAAR